MFPLSSLKANKSSPLGIYCHHKKKAKSGYFLNVSNDTTSKPEQNKIWIICVTTLGQFVLRT